MQPMMTGFAITRFYGSWIRKVSHVLPLALVLGFIGIQNPVTAQTADCPVLCGQTIGGQPGSSETVQASWAPVQFFTKTVFLEDDLFFSDELSSYTPGTEELIFVPGDQNFGIGIPGPIFEEDPFRFNQITYVEVRDKSEKLLIDFGCAQGFTRADITLNSIYGSEGPEQNRRSETGQWRAFNANFELIGTGTFTGIESTNDGGPGFLEVVIFTQEEFRYIELSAGPVGAEVKTSDFSDNSDFYVQGATARCVDPLKPGQVVGGGPNPADWEQVEIQIQNNDENRFSLVDDNDFTEDEFGGAGLGANGLITSDPENGTTDLVRIIPPFEFNSFQINLTGFFSGERGFVRILRRNENGQFEVVQEFEFEGEEDLKGFGGGGFGFGGGGDDDEGGGAVEIGGGSLQDLKNDTLPTPSDFIIVNVAFEPLTNAASEVVDFKQGPSLEGEVIQPRSFPINALGAPEDPSENITFVSLGLGGCITLKTAAPFANGEGDDLLISESNQLFDFPETFNGEEYECFEKADIFASQDGKCFIYLGQICGTGSVDLGILEWAQYVRIIDASNPEFVDISPVLTDGYDLNGILFTNGEADKLVPADITPGFATKKIRFRPGLIKNGNSLPLKTRLEYPKALGAPDAKDVLNKFVSLGMLRTANQNPKDKIGGHIILEFDCVVFDEPGDDVEVVEMSYGNPPAAIYPEQALVYVSKDNKSWVFLGKTNPEYKVDCNDKLDTRFDMAGKIDWFRYIKIFDLTDINAKKRDLETCQETEYEAFNSTADGFDLDAVVALHLAGDNYKSSNFEAANFANIDELTPSSLSPNPTQGQLNISFDQEAEFVSPDQDIYEVSIFNSQGFKVRDMKIASHNFKLEANLSGLPRGMYIVKVNTGFMSKTSKVKIY